MKCRLADVDLEYDVSGATRSPTLLLVHGFPHDRTLWAPQMHALSGTYQCVAVDLRGFGESGSAPPYSMDQHADDLAALLDAIGVERAVVAGLSMGGYIATAMWRRHAQRVQGFVLADTRAGADTDTVRVRRSEMMALVRGGGVSALPAQLAAAQLGASTRARQPELESAVLAMARRASEDGVLGALDAMMARPDSTNTLASITVPTLIVVGDEDILAPPVEAEQIHALVSGSRLDVIRGAGHLSNMERPAAFNAVVSAFAATICDTAQAQ
jgi:3-oxoadipate enol-lactonase